MKVILVFVSTLNGMITRGDDPVVRHWSSESDQAYYTGVWRVSTLIVMGSNTYRLNVITPSSSRLVLVMTRNPGQYAEFEKPGQLEFTSCGPAELVSVYSKRNHDTMTVVGGPSIASSFLREKLVDELWLTIEPKLFGKGLNLIAPVEVEADLRLIRLDRVNEKGTIITRYSVIR